MQRLTRDEEAKVLIYKGPATSYVEDVIDVARKEGYRLVDSRGLSKTFIAKMKGIEEIQSQKLGKEVRLMVVEGKDVKLFTPKPKATSNIPRSRDQKLLESQDAIAKAMETMSSIAEKMGTSGSSNNLESENASLKKEIEALKKAKKESK
jgi:hypothetical protein